MANGQLLVLQDHDTRISQMEHRLAVLPERTRLSELDQEQAQLERERQRAEQRQDELQREQTELEGELGRIGARVAGLDAKLAAGTVPRELQALSEERSQALVQQDQLEDVLLGVLDAVEEIEARLGDLASRAETLEAQRDEATSALAAAEEAIGGDLATERTARAEVEATVPAALLAEYERLRQRLGGVAAAALVGSSCGGCHLTLPAVEVDRLRTLPPDVVVHCEQCGRLLVRT